jgi:hypothetical protein
MRAQHTVELLVALKHAGGIGLVTSLLLCNVALLGLLGLGRLPCSGVNGTSYDSSLARPTAGEGGGEGAAGREGAGGHAPCRGDGRALEEHLGSNWDGVERVGVVIELGWPES